MECIINPRKLIIGNHGESMKRISFLLILSILPLAIIAFSFQADNANAIVNAAIIVVPPDDPTTDENGTPVYFTIQLDSQPSVKVDISLESDDTSEGRITSDPVIQFTQGNWKNPKQVEVTGWPDGEEDGDVIFHITGVSSSDDPAFDGLVMPNVTLTNINDPVPIAIDDYLHVDDRSPITIPVLDNDIALIESPFEITVVNDPLEGSYTIKQDPEYTITYNPLPTFPGIDQITYQVCDLDEDCSSANVIIKENVPPQIISASPVNLGDRLDVTTGEVTIEVVVIDNFQVDCVDFFRWDPPTKQHIQLGNVCLPPYEIVVDVGSLNFEWNQVWVQASDRAGNLSDYEFFWLYRLNPYQNFIPLILYR